MMILNFRENSKIKIKNQNKSIKIREYFLNLQLLSNNFF